MQLFTDKFHFYFQDIMTVIWGSFNFKISDYKMIKMMVASVIVSHLQKGLHLFLQRL